MDDNLKLVVSQQNPLVGDVWGNVNKVSHAIKEARAQDADLVLFSELFLSGYPPEDLVLHANFIADVAKGIELIAQETKEGKTACLVGAPYYDKDKEKLYNAAFLLEAGKVAYRVDKQHLPNYDVFDEMRVFAKGATPRAPFMFRGMRLAIRICEDIWEEQVEAIKDSDLLIVLNGSPYEEGKPQKRLYHCEAQVDKNKIPLVYVNQVGGQDELVFDGGSFVLSKDKTCVARLPSWQEANLLTEWQKTSAGWQATPLAENPKQESEQEATWQALTLGLRDYVNKNGFKSVVLGLSGGIDSALVAALACDALGAERVHCVRLPSRYTAQESQDDAQKCADALAVRLDTIEIEPLVLVAEKSLAPLFSGAHRDLTEENIQSRLRGLLLMALSNKFGAMLLSTGNKSEMSVGYATLYGDMNGGFNPIKDVYKMEVYALAEWRNKNFPQRALGKEGEVIPKNIITKAPSAELRENQKDEDSLPPYETLDNILQKLIDIEMPLAKIVASGHKPEVVQHIARLVRLAEYKRRQSPPGVRLSKRNFGKARRYPITNAYKAEENL